MIENAIDTGIKFFGLKIRLDSTGESEIDEVVKTVFCDDYNKTAPLGIERPDVKLLLEWNKLQGQRALFEK